MTALGCVAIFYGIVAAFIYFLTVAPKSWLQKRSR